MEIPDTIRDFKSYTAKRIIELITNNPQESRKEWLLYMFAFFAKKSTQNKEYQFWQKTNHPVELFTKDVFEQKVDYIHQNPVKSMMVNNALNYIYSSANPDFLLKMD